MLHYNIHLTQTIFALVIGILLLLMFIPIAKTQNIKEQKDKVYADVILATFGLVFWSGISTCANGSNCVC